MVFHPSAFPTGHNTLCLNPEIHSFTSSLRVPTSAFRLPLPTFPLTYGITGNTGKERLWEPVADLIGWMQARGTRFCLEAAVAAGLAARGLVDPAVCEAHESARFAGVDVLLSFGGDGTLLHSARAAVAHGIPLLGVNIGRLGFLADIEVGELRAAIAALEQGAYRTEARALIEAETPGRDLLPRQWALNEIVVERSGAAGLLTIHTTVGSAFLTDYWGDGLIVSTPTGSTAYALSVGGPIVSPEAGVVVLAPLAPHSLTSRPIVLPDTSEITLRVKSGGRPYVVAADGESTMFDEEDVPITLRRAEKTVQLVKLLDRHYFGTLRRKLRWGEEGKFENRDAERGMRNVGHIGSGTADRGTGD